MCFHNRIVTLLLNPEGCTAVFNLSQLNKEAKEQAEEARNRREYSWMWSYRRVWQPLHQWLKATHSPASALSGCFSVCKSSLLFSPVKFHNGLARAHSENIYNPKTWKLTFAVKAKFTADYSSVLMASLPMPDWNAQPCELLSFSCGYQELCFQKAWMHRGQEIG